jgi:hypothetical protein
MNDPDASQLLNDVASIHPNDIATFVENKVMPRTDALATLRFLFENHEERLDAAHQMNGCLAAAILHFGEAGVTILEDLLYAELDKLKKYTTVLEVLWQASNGDEICPFTVYPLPQSLRHRPDPDTQKAATRVLQEFVATALAEPMLSFRIISLLQRVEFLTAKTPGADNANAFSRLVRMIASTSLKISGTLVNQFEHLVNSDVPEFEYQKFLTANPVFLDPLAKRLLDRHRLGSEFIADFVLERLTGDYIIVEIEKPKTPIFNKAGDFSAEFSHAIRQVIDYRNWLADNIAYARTKLQQIGPAETVVVIGDTSKLTSEELNRLRGFGRWGPGIQVVGFNDLAERARTLVQNLISD